MKILGSEHAVVAILGFTVSELEEMYLKYGGPLEIARNAWIRMIESIKLDVPYNSASYFLDSQSEPELGLDVRSCLHTYFRLQFNLCTMLVMIV